jgi:hypothetical protein
MVPWGNPSGSVVRRRCHSGIDDDDEAVAEVSVHLGEAG